MKVAGYRGTLSVEDAMGLANRGIYVVNAMCVGGRDHLIHAYNKARENFKSGKNIARNFHMELMLVLSGRRQIKDALALCGVENAKSVVAISDKNFHLSLKENDDVLLCSNKKLEYLGISAVVPGKECDAFFENSAMLEIER